LAPGSAKAGGGIEPAANGAAAASEFADNASGLGNAGRDHHEQRIQDVVCGNHARAMAGRATRLDQCIQRHDVKAAEQADQEQIRDCAPCPTLRDELPWADPGMLGAAWGWRRKGPQQTG